LDEVGHETSVHIFGHCTMGNLITSSDQNYDPLNFEGVKVKLKNSLFFIRTHIEYENLVDRTYSEHRNDLFNFAVF